MNIFPLPGQRNGDAYSLRLPGVQHLLLQVLSIAVVAMALGAWAMHWIYAQTGAASGSVLISTAFAGGLFACGSLLCLAWSKPRLSTALGVASLALILIFRGAPEWAAFWPLGRPPAANLGSLLVVVGSMLAIWMPATIETQPTASMRSSLIVIVLGAAATVLASCFLADATRAAPQDDTFSLLPELFFLTGLIITFLFMVSLHLTRVAQAQSLRLRDYALRDPLTGLPNRRVLEKRLRAACEQARKEKTDVAVVFLDLDGIEFINNSLGHAIGDKLLVRASQRMQELVGGKGMVAHLTSDEFVVLFTGVPQPEVEQYTRELIQALAQPYFVEHGGLRASASAGIRVSSGNVEDPLELIREADLAMLRAKQEGRNTWHMYTHDMSAAIAKRLALRNDLQQAMDTDALELHYQPIVDGLTGRVVSVESLLRWRHPERGLIQPSQFIPLAEETGQIIRLTEWALETACQACHTLRKHGLLDVRVVVNISPLYFQRADFVQSIRRALHNAGLPGTALEIEITESLLLANKEEAVTKLAELRGIGLFTSIDDFGTGYSSLNYLKNLPVDKIKIDRSFVTDIVTDTADAAISQGIISMAHHLGLRVVAEGIETEAQLAFLKRNYCDEFQGYLLARPVPMDALISNLSAGNCRIALPDTPDVPTSDRVLLLIDDEKNVLNALVRLLRRDGYQILTATNPGEAFNILATHDVQVVVCDQRMPEMNGTEFFSKVKDLYPNTVRMILSGYTELKSVTDAINRGAIYKYLTKPWDDEELRSDVQQAFKDRKPGADLRGQTPYGV